MSCNLLRENQLEAEDKVGRPKRPKLPKREKKSQEEVPGATCEIVIACSSNCFSIVGASSRLSSRAQVARPSRPQ